MKKIVYCAGLVCLLFAAISCKSTKAEKPEVSQSEESAVTATEAGEETGKENAEGEATEKASEQPKKAVDLAAEPALAESKDFTGWIKSSRKNIKERYGKIQIKIKSRRGSYNIAALNENDKPISVLSTANEYVTNAFYLKTSKKIYNLITDGNVRSGARRTTDGAQILYEVPTVAQVSVNFACMASEKEKDADMIKVTATVKNISNRNDEFSFKAILDTVLGESAVYHFYTFEDVPVKNEVLYRTLQNQKWFVSKNLNAQMQLFFTGADCTTPDLVALSNYSTLEKNSWEPDMLSYRVFDTVLSYNNSAVCAIWKPMKLAPSESGKVVFYIALSGNGGAANGEKYIYSKEYTTEETSEKTDTEKTAVKPVEIISSESPTGVTEIDGSDILITEASEATTEIPNVDFYIKNMTKEHLTPEYIQSLLDRIAALEEDSPSLNRQELLQLNAELDAILTYLRQ